MNLDVMPSSEDETIDGVPWWKNKTLKIDNFPSSLIYTVVNNMVLVKLLIKMENFVGVNGKMVNESNGLKKLI